MNLFRVACDKYHRDRRLFADRLDCIHAVTGLQHHVGRDEIGKPAVDGAHRILGANGEVEGGVTKVPKNIFDRNGDEELIFDN